MEQLAGKNILMIGVKFYHYNQEIIRKLEDKGARVVFFYERDTSIKHAIIDAFFDQYMDRWQALHYDRILKRIEGLQFDYLLVIRGYKMPLDFVDRIRRANPAIKTIMYQWDSLNNWDYRDKLPLFDVTYSFDYEDCKQLGLKYIPTFHTDEFMLLPQTRCVYDMFFYGNYTQERYAQMRNLMEFAEKKGYRLSTHLFLTRKRFFRENLRGANLSRTYVSFKRMQKEEYLKRFNQSNIIVDLTTTTQSGLAMRVLDALAAGKKLITNNVFIRNESFYHPDQIYVLENEAIDVPASFFEVREFQKISHSLDQWIENIFA